MTTGKALNGKPYAGKLHVRFDEGAGVPYGGVPLYSTRICMVNQVWKIRKVQEQ